MDLKAFCEKFGVDYVVVGSIRSSGKGRISVELSDAKDDSQI